MSSKPTQSNQTNPPKVEITTLPLPQLQDLKSQLDTELTHLSTSFQSLRTAQSKFRDCLTSLSTGLRSTNTSNGNSTTTTTTAADAEVPKAVLVPLTSSLYVPGRLTDTEHVLVDVGTGFFVEKDVPGATEFYERKVRELGESLKGLEGVIQGKAQNVRVVEEVMRVKALNQHEEEAKGKAS